MQEQSSRTYTTEKKADWKDINAYKSPYISRIGKFVDADDETDATTKDYTEDELETETETTDATTTETTTAGVTTTDVTTTKVTTAEVTTVEITTANATVAETTSPVSFTTTNEATKVEDVEEDERTENDVTTVTEFKIPPKSAVSLKVIRGKLVCVVGTDYYSGLAQEPWPKDVKLYQPYEVEQILLPDNANCLAVQAFLRICNLEFEVVSRANAEFMSPSGKVPFIKCGAFIISELEGIVQFVNNKGISLTSNLEAEQKSDMRAYMSLVHTVLENAELYLCWIDKETYNEVTKPRNGSVYPWPLNHFQTWSKRSAVCKRLKIMGWYDKTLEDVYQEVENCCQALTDRLEGKEYFFGKRYTELDALVYGHIYSILTTALPADDNKLAYLVKSYEKLINHCKRVHEKVMNRKNNVLDAFYSSSEGNIISTASDTEGAKETLYESDDAAEGGSNTSTSDVTSEDLLATDL